MQLSGKLTLATHFLRRILGQKQSIRESFLNFWLGEIPLESCQTHLRVSLSVSQVQQKLTLATRPNRSYPQTSCRFQ